MPYIYIVPRKHFQPPLKVNHTCRYSEVIDFIYDYTLNFTDLNYWDTDVDLNNNTIANVLHKLSLAIRRLTNEGVVPYPSEPKPNWDIESYDNKWLYGFYDLPQYGMSRNLPDNERKRCLLYHLINIYNKLLKINKKNKLMYCYIFYSWHQYY